MDYANKGLENETPAVGLILFVLRAFPQAIKVFGMKSFPSTEAWGVSYFAVYILTVFTIVSRSPGPKQFASTNST
jgi:hypothetical protein